MHLYGLDVDTSDPLDWPSCTLRGNSCWTWFRRSPSRIAFGPRNGPLEPSFAPYDIYIQEYLLYTSSIYIYIDFYIDIYIHRSTSRRCPPSIALFLSLALSSLGEGLPGAAGEGGREELGAAGHGGRQPGDGPANGGAQRPERHAARGEKGR